MEAKCSNEDPAKDILINYMITLVFTYPESEYIKIWTV